MHSSRWAPGIVKALALLYAASTLLYSILWMVDARVKPDLPTVELGFDTDFLESEKAQTVKYVLHESPAEKAGLLQGDKIVAIDSHAINDGKYLVNTWKQHSAGDTVQLIVNRPGVNASLHITGVLRLRQSARGEGNLQYLAGEVRNSFPVPFVVVGLVVLFLRVGDPSVWLLALLCGGFISTPAFSNGLAVAPSLLSFITSYKVIFTSLLAPLFYFFFAIFPTQSPIDRRVPWLKWASLVLGLTFAISGFRTGQTLLPPPFHAFAGDLLSSRITLIFLILFLALGILSLGLNFAMARDPEVRRKIRVILWGSAVGVTPSLIRAAAENFWGYRSPEWLTTTLVVLLFLFPLSFAYAVVKHRVLEIPVLLKRSARYLLVQRGFTLLLSLASIGVILLFALSLSHYLQTAVNIAQPVGIAFGAAFGTLLLWGGTQVHRRVSGRIDRAFFRSAYDARMILENLAKRSSTATDRQELAHMLEDHLAAALQPGSLYIYLRAGDDQLNVASGNPPADLRIISLQLPLLTELTARGQPMEYISAPRGSESEISPLASLSPECLVPMVGRGERLVGLLVLGSRLSEEPYSNEDKRLLSSVATQAATALENMNLAQEIAERIESERRVIHEMEISRRLLEADNNRKTKELEEARELQLSMLPGTLPVLPNLDIAVYMKTATEVGGDYYDFAVGVDGTLTVAVGDATGHGAKAGTMVVAAKSLFNGFSDTPDLLEIFRKLTSSIKRLNMRPMYMSMLLLRINGRTAVVSSAGMPCPLIYRSATGDVEEVSLKGMPLGAFLDFPYEQKKLELSTGDAIVLMSDGFPEMFNNEQETLGYSRVKEIIQEVGQKRPQEIIGCLAKAGEEWANGKGQDDDVTFVVQKMK